MLKRNSLFPVFLILALLASGCSAILPQPTATPLPATATLTPQPTFTATIEPTSTPQPTSTPTATPDAKATKGAIATATAVAAIKTIDGILKQYDLSTSEGQLGEMFGEPLTLSASTYGARHYFVMSEIPYADFALYTEISWASSSGLAGCALTFRMEDLALAKDSYSFNTLRLSGAPAWDVEWSADGRFKTNATGKIMYNKIINVDNGDSNAYLLIVRGKNITVYANGQKLGQGEIAQRLDGGAIAAIVFQESGETTCTFRNSWVWKYK
jgi:hypothetical protein